jgi:hypothetical protein
LRISKNIKRRILFGEALAADLGRAWNAMNSSSQKKAFRASLTFKFMKKYRFMSAAKPFLPLENYHKERRSLGSKKRAFSIVRNCVVKFFQQDDVSVQAPGKKDCITKNKVKKQKRFLCNSLKFLYRKFCEENEFLISYASFCRMRPFWVVNMKISERDTCLCQKCENISLLFQTLRKEKILDGDLDTLIKNEMCCSPRTLDCFYRKCTICADNFFTFGMFNDDKTTWYDAWEKVEEPSSTDGKMYQRTIKT